MAPWTIQVTNWPPAWESLDLIYKNIQLLNSVSSFKSLMVTSALAEGKSTLALGLALSAARLHQRVLLIDADLRRPNLHKLVNLPNEQGLSTLLTTDANVPSQSSIQSSGSHIDIVTAGPMPADPANLLSSHAGIDGRFEQTYDLVLVDAAGSRYGGCYLNSVILQWCSPGVTHWQSDKNRTHAGYSHAEQVKRDWGCSE